MGKRTSVLARCGGCEKRRLCKPFAVWHRITNELEKLEIVTRCFDCANGIMAAGYDGYFVSRKAWEAVDLTKPHPLTRR